MCVCVLKTRKKIGLWILLVLFPVFVLLDYLFLYPVPLSTLLFAIPSSVAVVSLFFFSREINYTVLIPIMFLFAGFFVVFPSTLGPHTGVEVYPFMIGTFFMLMGLAATVLVLVSSYKK